MTRRTPKIQNEDNTSAQKHSEAFVALVDLVRHMARCAAQNDYEAMLKAAKKKNEIIADLEDPK